MDNSGMFNEVMDLQKEAMQRYTEEVFLEKLRAIKPAATDPQRLSAWDFRDYEDFSRAKQAIALTMWKGICASPEAIEEYLNG